MKVVIDSNVARECALEYSRVFVLNAGAAPPALPEAAYLCSQVIDGILMLHPQHILF